jgi:hypothetical protein
MLTKESFFGLLEKDICFSKRLGFFKPCWSHGNFESGFFATKYNPNSWLNCVYLQGTRVWLRENGQHFPSTVNSCAEGVVVFRTDYGQVRTSPHRVLTPTFCCLPQGFPQHSHMP